MTDAILCIGSNVADGAEMIAHSLGLLLSYGCCVTARSDVYQWSSPYYNFVVRVRTQLTYDELHRLSKVVERTLGRAPRLKALGVVPVDIDIVVYDGRVVRQRDFDAPYFAPGYRQLQLQHK